MVQDRCPVKTHILLSHQGAAKSHEKLLSIDSTKYLFRDKIGYECEINFKLEQPLGKFCDQNLTKKRVLRHLSLIPCTSGYDVIYEQPLREGFKKSKWKFKMVLP